MRGLPVTIDPVSLRERADRARRALGTCTLCERRCGVDRLRGDVAPCGLGAETWCFKRHVSLAEEHELLPSYMVYLGGCNFRCRFCVQGATCFAPKLGHRVDAAEAAEDFLRVLRNGARTINLLGGEPSLHPHTILEIAAEAGQPLHLVLNTNLYMTVEVIDLLEGVIDTWLADFKFGNDRCARELAGVDRYLEVVTRNLRIVAGRGRTMVRHLLMPGHLECCMRPVATWMAENLPGVAFNLMTGYVPAWRASGDPRLGRCLTSEEREEAQGIVEQLGLRSNGHGPSQHESW